MSSRVHTMLVPALAALMICVFAAGVRANPASNGGAAAPVASGSTSASGATGVPSGGGAPSRTPAANTRSRSAAKQRVRERPSSTRRLTALITSVDCYRVSNTKCAKNHRAVQETGELVISGHHFSAGLRVLFPRWSAHSARFQPGTNLRPTRHGYVVSVPKGVRSGRIVLVSTSGATSNAYGPVTILPAPPPPPRPVTAAPAATEPGATSAAFDAAGMWIWYLNRSDGGDLTKIAAQAASAGIKTLFVKSSDGSSNFWSQFTPQLVQSVHALGLQICAWQYVYGTHPAGEAEMGIEAVRDGADCLVIDAESEYEGNYAGAQTYIDDLRAGVGASYPVGLASFPYVNDHESEPYSVFLGPGGAQFNVPQVYWHDIGTTPDVALAQTYLENGIYGRPIVPLGQTYGGVAPAQILRFRELAASYGAPGLSWWSWQATIPSGWAELAAPLAPLTGGTLVPGTPLLAKGMKGDQVIWMQEHLAAAVASTPTSGVFDAATQADLETFQSSHALPRSGVTDGPTWAALLSLPPIVVRWTGTPPPVGATGSSGSSGFSGGSSGGASGPTGSTGSTGTSGSSGASPAVAGGAAAG